jgi:hypothetical protein
VFDVVDVVFDGFSWCGWFEHGCCCNRPHELCCAVRHRWPKAEGWTSGRFEPNPCAPLRRGAEGCEARSAEPSEQGKEALGSNPSESTLIISAAFRYFRDLNFIEYAVTGTAENL